MTSSEDLRQTMRTSHSCYSRIKGLMESFRISRSQLGKTCEDKLQGSRSSSGPTSLSLSPQSSCSSGSASSLPGQCRQEHIQCNEQREDGSMLAPCSFSHTILLQQYQWSICPSRCRDDLTLVLSLAHESCHR